MDRLGSKTELGFVGIPNCLQGNNRADPILTGLWVGGNCSQGIYSAKSSDSSIQKTQLGRFHQLSDAETARADEKRIHAAWTAEAVQKRRKRWLDRDAKFKIFREGNHVLMFNSKTSPHYGKLKLRWIGPYRISDRIGHGTFKLETLSGEQVEKAVNGFRLCPYKGVMHPTHPTDRTFPIRSDESDGKRGKHFVHKC